jgi:adenylosuccinate synthase
VKEYNKLSAKTRKFISDIEHRYATPVQYIGTSEEDMIDRGY